MNRIIDTNSLIDIIANLCKKACFELNDNVMEALTKAHTSEQSPYGKDAIKLFIENAKFAKKEQIACCQDTGTTIVILEVGQEISFTGIPLTDAVNAGVRKGYQEGYLRKSIVEDPLNRINTNDNTPCILHTEIIAGDKLNITVMPKGVSGGGGRWGRLGSLSLLPALFS